MTEASVVAAAVAAAKAMVRVEGTGEDAVMHRLVRAAIEAAEAFCGQRLIEREVTQALTGTGAWQALGERPASAITTVTGSGGATLAVGAYAIDVADGVGRVRLPAGVAALVTYRAGLAPRWTALPAPIAHGVVLLAVHWWENRRADGGGDPALPAAVAALWRPHRRMGIGG